MDNNMYSLSESENPVASIEPETVSGSADENTGMDLNDVTEETNTAEAEETGTREITVSVDQEAEAKSQEETAETGDQTQDTAQINTSENTVQSTSAPAEISRDYTGLIGAAACALLLAVVLAALLVKKKAKEKARRKKKVTDVSRTAPLDTKTSGAVALRGGIQIGNAQAIGARKEQQDSFGISDDKREIVAEKGLLAVVADGMGGLSNGTVYSKAAVQAALRSFSDEGPEKSDEATLLRILKRAREAVEATGLKDGGTTFIATLIHNQQLHFISVGDSRISLMRNGGLIQLNREHVYGRELDDLAMNGLVSEEDAAQDKQRAALTSYVGKQSEILIDRNINAIPLYPGDKVILMSDGVYGYMPEDELTRLLRQKPMDAALAVQNALLAKARPNQDNLTIVILEID